MEPEPEAAAQDGRYAGLVQVQFGGKGTFEPAMLTLEPGTPSLTFRSEGGDVLRTGSAVGCDVGRPKSAAEGHDNALQLDLAEKDSEGDSQYILSVADEARREAWEAALGAYAGGEASAPSVAYPSLPGICWWNCSPASLFCRRGFWFSNNLPLPAKCCTINTGWQLPSP